MVALLVVVGFGQNCFADALFVITEAYQGVSGEDGTEDWFEVTNLGTMVGDTAVLWYDDSSADPTIAGNLDSFLLNPGESAVFVIGDDTDVSEFNSIWAGVANVGLTNGGGGLGGEDALFLFDSNDADASVVNSVGYRGLDNVLVAPDTYATIQFDQFGNSFSSALNDGVSAEFFNDNLSSPDDLIQLAGDPGTFEVVPEPSSVLLLVFGATAFVFRRSKGNLGFC